MDPWQQFCRFLRIGIVNVHYSPKQKRQLFECLINLTKQKKVEDMLNEIIRVATNNLSIDTTFCIQVIAYMIALIPPLKRIIYWDVLPVVCKTIPELTYFLKHVPRSWGRTTRRALEAWMYNIPADELAYQMTVYRNSNGFSCHDLLRLIHPRPKSTDYQALFAYVSDRYVNDCTEFIDAVEVARHTRNVSIASSMIVQHNLSWKHIGCPQLLHHGEIWHAFLSQPLSVDDLVPQLPHILKISNKYESRICELLGDVNYVKAGSFCPSLYLRILRQLQSKELGSNALHGAVESALHMYMQLLKDRYPSSSDKRFQIVLDVSGSMACSHCMGMKFVSAREVSVLLTMMFMHTESHVTVKAFSDTLRVLDFQREDTFEMLVKKASHLSFDDTDIAAAIEHATNANEVVDCFVIITDESPVGQSATAVSALRKYQNTVHAGARLVVLATTTRCVHIAESYAQDMLDIAGFDEYAFEIIRMFAHQCV